MFSKSLQAALITLATLAVSVAAGPALSVDVTGPTSVDGVNNLKLTTTIKNTGDLTLKVLNEPRGALNKLPTNTFALKSASGSTPDFTGVKVKYVPEVAAKAKAYTVISPGQTVTIEHDLTHTYDFTKSGEGQYTVTPSENFYIIDDVTGEVAPITASVASKHTVNVTGTLRVPRQEIAKRASFNGCSSSQQSALNTAASNAQSYASSSASYLSSHTSSSARFTTWFGTWTSSHRSLVLDHFTKINSRSFSGFTYDCTCTDSGTYAYVYPGTTGVIYLCGAFWNAPATGTDSKAGTLVHESSHFTVNGGTQDYAYGQSACKSLAISNSNNAVMNADCHEYFAENTPAQS